MRKRMITIAAGVAALVALGLGGAAIAGAAGAFDDESASIGGPAAQQARDAALRATGGGAAGSVERDSEQGATYEVEVRKPDGSTVDVRLDGSFGVLTVDGDSETNDADDANGDSETNDANDD